MSDHLARERNNNEIYLQEMLLRDYFAGQCLANPAICNADEYYSVIAKQCYDMADAMLEARKQ
jgi:hypothetical protein